MTSNERSSIGQLLVHWLWAFLFFVIGLAQTITPRPGLAVLTRIVFLGGGAAALVACSAELWRALRTIREPKSPVA